MTRWRTVSYQSIFLLFCLSTCLDENTHELAIAGIALSKDDIAVCDGCIGGHSDPYCAKAENDHLR